MSYCKCIIQVWEDKWIDANPYGYPSIEHAKQVISEIKANDTEEKEYRIIKIN